MATKLFNPEPTATTSSLAGEHRTSNIERPTSKTCQGRLKAELRTRRGYTILELTIALGIFAAMLATVGQTVALVAQQRRLTQRRELAQQSAENVMEHLFARAWDELTAEKTAEVKLPEGVERDLPGASLKIELVEQAGPPPARRIKVAVGWNDAAGPVSTSATVTAWRYQP
jgi:type II secretory pathway pseudopilin PulG